MTEISSPKKISSMEDALKSIGYPEIEDPTQRVANVFFEWFKKWATGEIVVEKK